MSGGVVDGAGEFEDGGEGGGSSSITEMRGMVLRGGCWGSEPRSETQELGLCRDVERHKSASSG